MPATHCEIPRMRSLLLVFAFIGLTFLCWGIYGPVLHVGQEAMAHSSLRPFICVGLAYFLVAVVVPTTMLQAKREPGGWTVTGTIWSLAAGTAGAFGALGIIVAFKNGGRPVYVMPLVFGCAPVVNTFVTMLMARSFRQAGSLFFLSVVLVALGAGGVLFFQPGGQEINIAQLQVGQLAMILFSIALTALCWGAYGPVLHRGQLKMGGSRLRPFLCVGLAYFAIAVIVPLAVLSVWTEPGRWDMDGMFWSLAAGAAGAVGALGIILAFNFGGKPIFVMPLVFGGAPVVNTFTTIVAQGTLGEVRPLFYISLAMVILGAVGVLVFAPRGHAKPATGAKEATIAPKNVPAPKTT
jgi:hypothetical protein